MAFLQASAGWTGAVGLGLLGLLPAPGRAQILARNTQDRPSTAVKPAQAAPGSRAATALPTAAPTASRPNTRTEIARDSIYAAPPVPAVFPGGMSALGAYIGANMRFPEKARLSNVTGRVLVQFILGKDGRVQDAHVVSGPGAGLNEEAHRLVWLMPPWEPGRLADGQPVRVNCTLPITFRAPSQ